jgi:hypothetical protein
MAKLEDRREPGDASWIAIEQTSISRCPYIAGRRMSVPGASTAASPRATGAPG